MDGRASTLKSVRLHLVEQGFDVARGAYAERQAQRRARQHHGEDIRGYSARDVASLRADGHPNTDFTAPLQYRIIQHAIETDTRKQKGNAREEYRERSQKTFANGMHLINFGLSASVGHAEFRLRPRYFLAQNFDESERV